MNRATAPSCLSTGDHLYAEEFGSKERLAADETLASCEEIATRFDRLDEAGTKWKFRARIALPAAAAAN